MYKITQEQLNQLVAHLNEVPHKYAVGMIQILQTLAKEEPKEAIKPKKDVPK